ELTELAHGTIPPHLAALVGLDERTCASARAFVRADTEMAAAARSVLPPGTDAFDALADIAARRTRALDAWQSAGTTAERERAGAPPIRHRRATSTRCAGRATRRRARPSTCAAPSGPSRRRSPSWTSP